MTLIVGSEGSMGKRYQAILNYLGEPFECFDARLGRRPRLKVTSETRRIIIATPTNTHLYFVEQLDQYGLPILCEKPLSADLNEVERILNCKSPLSMMAQYTKLAEPFSEGLSWYDFYHAGPDELKWSCFQIIALARAEVQINNTSPVWTCGLNGHELSKNDMDKAYVDSVIDFLNGRYIERQRLHQWHEKVSKYV